MTSRRNVKGKRPQASTSIKQSWLADDIFYNGRAGSDEEILTCCIASVGSRVSEPTMKWGKEQNSAFEGRGRRRGGAHDLQYSPVMRTLWRSRRSWLHGSRHTRTTAETAGEPHHKCCVDTRGCDCRNPLSNEKEKPLRSPIAPSRCGSEPRV